MKFVLGAAALAAATLIPGAAAGGAPAAAPPAAALGVSPLRIEMKGASTAAIAVRNPGARPLVVTVSRAGFARTLHGKPRIEAARGAAGWLRARPNRLRLAPHATASFQVTARPPVKASPGDHPALVLLATHPRADKKVRVVLRVGVVVLVRVSGTIVHRLVAQALSVRRHGKARLFSLRLANRGNVAERIDSTRVKLVLRRHGKPIATLRVRRLDLLPHSVGIAEFAYRGRARGVVVAHVDLRPPAIGRARSFRVRLR